MMTFIYQMISLLMRMDSIDDMVEKEIQISNIKHIVRFPSKKKIAYLNLYDPLGIPNIIEYHPISLKKVFNNAHNKFWEKPFFYKNLLKKHNKFFSLLSSIEKVFEEYLKECNPEDFEGYKESFESAIEVVNYGKNMLNSQNILLRILFRKEKNEIIEMMEKIKSAYMGIILKIDNATTYNPETKKIAYLRVV